MLARYNQLGQKEKNLIDKAFSNNMEVAEYLQLKPYRFTDDAGKQQTVQIPAGDIFHQFRKDVDSGNLPTVSWLAAPQAFSDHTSSPLYGTWYVSEALNILTKNPEVWKKTIFILNYDENDGYYDHLPPFVVPDPNDPATGKVSEGIDITSDFDTATNWPIGLGYRVPMIIASPWSKGGFINSQIHDHTSTLMFLEKFLQKKTGKNIVSKNISSWRRTVCGDLTSAFRPYNGERYPLPEFLKKTQVIDNIQNAKNKPAQVIPQPLTAAEIASINQNHPFSAPASQWVAEQEKGTRPACALPYIIYADCHLTKERGTVELKFEAAANDHHIGTAFNMYTPSAYKKEAGKTWFYTVKEKDTLTDSLQLQHFDRNIYDLCINGVNGFFRHYRGNAEDGDLSVSCNYEEKKGLVLRYTGNIILGISNHDNKAITILLTDNAYGRKLQQFTIEAGGKKNIQVDLKKSNGWYDFTLTVKGNEIFKKQYAGHVETGEISITDPFMGGLLS